MESHEPPIVARPHPSDSLLFSGSDHRFAQSPQGDNARDLNHLVDLLGFSPGEALPCGRRVRGQLMNLGNEPGQLKEGYLADLLFVDGDPLEDLDLVVRGKSFSSSRRKARCRWNARPCLVANNRSPPIERIGNGRLDVPLLDVPSQAASRFSALSRSGAVKLVNKCRPRPRCPKVRRVSLQKLPRTASFHIPWVECRRPDSAQNNPNGGGSCIA
jgi:hypothetical protein